MRKRIVSAILTLAGFAAVVGTAWALDEAVLTPTPERSGGKPSAMTQKVRADSDKEFDAAMSVWFKHRYADGERLLGKFAAKYPNSRWRAEAELHQGCYYTYLGATGKAKPIFQRLASEFADTNISTKAQLRLANIAEREARTNDAISGYTRILGMNPTWDQFKYANYRARKLAMTGGKLQARINCGPVALAACLNAMGRKSEAAKAREVKPTTDGLSLAQLQSLCAKHHVPVRSAKLSLSELGKAKLPILAYVEPKHFIAVLAVHDGKTQIEDSIRGSYETTLDELGKVWSGKVLTFAPSRDMKPLTRVALLETVGGCCGQIEEDECCGDACPCQQDSSGPAMGGPKSGGGGCGAGRMCALSAGRPTWQVNVDSLNILVTDTPAFYDPGKGPSVAFTLRYSNENSNTGIFGRGWRCPYDMKVFFLPSAYPGYPTLQVHRDSGRIETYEWNDADSKYEPRSSSASYGYRDTIELASGAPILSLRGGGKYYFMPSGGPAEGRIHIIEDAAGNQVTCDYDSTTGCLATVTDAGGGITDIVNNGLSGINERVTNIRIPRYVNGSWVRWSENNTDHALDREAVLTYSDGNLISITDMLGETSTLSYNAMLFYTDQASAQDTTAQAITTTSPTNGGAIPLYGITDLFLSSGKIRINNDEEIAYTGKTTKAFTGITRGANPVAAAAGSTVVQIVPNTTLSSAITETSQSLVVDSTASFPDKGWIAVVGALGAETMYYTGKTGSSFTGITRGEPAYAAATGSSVYLCSQTPYLSEIVTPSMKTKFTYKWAGNGTTGQFVTLHGVYECGPTESYPQQPTMTYDWDGALYQTTETRYGDRTKIYDFGAGAGDAARYTQDELGNAIVQYEYNGNRDRTSVTDASLHTIRYDYGNDGEHNLYFIDKNSPTDYKRAFSYYDDHSIHTEKDAYGVTVKTYTYNTAGQVTRTDMPLGIYTTNTYDTLGRMTSSTDGRGMTTHYYYETTSEPRGFLTSVEDAESKTIYYHYDQYGRKDEVTDPSGNMTKYEYDALDRVTKTIFGSATNAPYAETRYTCCHKVYDQDENGRRIYYVYDAKLRPYKTIISAAWTTLATGITVDIPANDGTGTLAVADASGLSSNGGDLVVLDEIIHYAGITGNTLTGITRGYYNTRKVEVDSGFPVGRVDSVQATYGYHTQYLDWMTSIADALGHTTYYEYYLNGKPKTIRYPDDTGERYTYDNNNSGLNMITKEYGTFSGTYPSQTFTANDNFTVHYEYDDNNRLTNTYH